MTSDHSYDDDDDDDDDVASDDPRTKKSRDSRATLPTIQEEVRVKFCFIFSITVLSNFLIYVYRRRRSRREEKPAKVTTKVPVALLRVKKMATMALRVTKKRINSCPRDLQGAVGTLLTKLHRLKVNVN
jgi:hypothetical protein